MGIFEAIWCALIKFCNVLIEYVLDTVVSTLGWVIAFLPSIPWTPQPLQWGDFGRLVGYFIPIADMLTHFTLILGLVIIWFSVQHILRIVKAIK